MHNSSIECTDLDSYLLPSKRSKIRKIKTANDKQLLKLDKELDQMHTTIWKMRSELVDLVPPVQRGWKRTYVLRPDMAVGPYAEFFQQLLDKINVTHISHRKDFKVKKRYKRKRCYMPTKQYLKKFSEEEFKRAKLSDMERAYFAEQPVYNPWRKRWDKEYVFTEPWRFVLKVSANIISKVPMRDLELEAQRDRLWDYLDASKRFCRITWLRGKSNNFRWYEGELPKYANPFKNVPLHSIVEMYELGSTLRSMDPQQFQLALEQ